MGRTELAEDNYLSFQTYTSIRQREIPRVRTILRGVSQGLLDAPKGSVCYNAMTRVTTTKDDVAEDLQELDRDLGRLLLFPIPAYGDSLKVGIARFMAPVVFPDKLNAQAIHDAAEYRFILPTERGKISLAEHLRRMERPLKAGGTRFNNAVHMLNVYHNVLAEQYGRK